ncbi:LamG domain-containing protein [Candidatus Woesearchaeota archaeon]|nr:LamG domain-containing protein [Candidatus Woesearchaeota archaeon]
MSTKRGVLIFIGIAILININLTLADLNNGLVLHLKFDNNSLYGENNTHFYDYSGTGNNATCSGINCPTYNSSGRINGAFDFDGTDDQLDILDDPSLRLSNNLTIAGWINIDNTGIGNWNPIITKGNTTYAEYWFGVSDSFRGNRTGTLINDWDSSSYGLTPVNPSEWHHIAMTYNSSHFSIYLDGYLDNTSHYYGNPINTFPHDLIIGSSDKWSDEYTGLMDDLRVYNRTLSLEEIKELASIFMIKNLGVLGFEETNQEYTSIKTVILENSIYDSANNCRYRNNESSVWTPWEQCEKERYWLITDNTGLKEIWININYTDDTQENFSDTIYYNYTGAGLDTTPPSTVTIYDGDYSNSYSTVNATWSAATDPESEILDIPLVYSYQLSINGVPNSSWITTGTTRSFSYSVNLSHNDNVSITVNVTNSANLISSTGSDGLLIDLVLPNITVIDSNLNQSSWHNDTSIFFNWSSSDNFSGIGGFSYTLSTDPAVGPDDVPEGSIGSLDTHFNNTFYVFKTGIYTFKIKTKDKADNWGNITSRNVKIDRTPPLRPLLRTAEKVFGTNQINFTWSESYDEHSSLDYYFIEIWNTTSYNYSSNDLQFNASIGTNQYYMYTPANNFSTYYARIRGIDMVKNPSVWSNEDAKYDWTPPIITIIRPDTLIDTGVYPSLAVSTDEQATCYYDNSTGSQIMFEYTNQTYHETKPKDSQTQYNVTCYDISGNSQTDTTGVFATNAAYTSITLPSSPSGYTGQIITLNVSIVPAKGEVLKSKFKLYLNNSQHDFTIYDNGAGEYIVSLVAPSIAGNYPINMSVDTQTDTDTLTVNQLSLEATYSNVFATTSETDKITYFNATNYSSGFATDSEVTSFSSAANLLNITSGYDGKIYFFATKKLQNPPEKDRKLKAKTFTSQKTPSFGYPQQLNYLLQNTLIYSDIDINGSETLNSGSRTLLIKRLRDKNKKTVLVTTKISGYDEKGVMQHG